MRKSRQIQKCEFDEFLNLVNLTNLVNFLSLGGVFPLLLIFFFARGFENGLEA